MRLKTIPAEAETKMHLSLNKGHFVRRAVPAVGRLEENGDSGFRLVAIAAAMRKGLAVNRTPHATQARHTASTATTERWCVGVGC